MEARTVSIMNSILKWLTVVTSLHYYIQLQGNIKKLCVYPPDQDLLRWDMGCRVKWLGNRMTSSGRLKDTAESLGFIVQILLSDFKRHFTEVVLELKRCEEGHVLNVWIFCVSFGHCHMFPHWNWQLYLIYIWCWSPTLKVIRQIIFGPYWYHIAPTL
jgi:hypothetical protein